MDEEYLRYYVSEDISKIGEEQGNIELDDLKEVIYKTTDWSINLIMKTSQRIYELRAENQTEFKKWIGPLEKRAKYNNK